MRLRAPLGVTIERTIVDGNELVAARWDEAQLFAEDSTVHDALSGLAQEIVAAYRDVAEEKAAGRELGGYVQRLWNLLDRVVETA